MYSIYYKDNSKVGGSGHYEFEVLQNLGHQDYEQAIKQAVDFAGDVIRGLAKEGKRASIGCTLAYVGMLVFNVENSDRRFGSVGVKKD